MELVTIESGTAKTTSLVVAETFEKRHADVLRDIEKLDCSGDFRERNFALSEYTSDSGQKRKYKYCIMTRDGWTILAMGFTGKKAMEFKEKYIAAFNQMEALLQQRATEKSTALNFEVSEYTSDSEVASKPKGFNMAEVKEQLDLAMQLAFNLGFRGTDVIQVALEMLKKNTGFDFREMSGVTYLKHTEEAKQIAERRLDTIVNKYARKYANRELEVLEWSKAEFALRAILLDRLGDNDKYTVDFNFRLPECADKRPLIFDAGVRLREDRDRKLTINKILMKLPDGDFNWLANLAKIEVGKKGPVSKKKVLDVMRKIQKQKEYEKPDVSMYKLMFEYQGAHHYHADMTKGYALEKFQRIQRHDQIKRRFCKEYKIPLVEIPYYEDIEVAVLENLHKNELIEVDDLELAASRQLITGNTGNLAGYLY